MGASESVQVAEDAEEEEEEEEDGVEDENEEHERRELELDLELDDDNNSLSKKLLEQEPEMLPCHASASPLSPQLSSFGTPRLGPSIKVWDPYNVLAPPPPLPPHFSRSFSSSVVDDDRSVTEVFLISHGECHMNLRPDLVGGRCPDAALTPSGKRQARALAVFMKSQGIRFSAVYTSPLDRARATAVSVCQEMNFSDEQIQTSDALLEMSQGHWEGCHRSEIYTPEILTLMDRVQPDFSAPSGESLRQVEFRMAQFLTGTVLEFTEKLRSDFSPPDHPHGPNTLTNSFQPHWDSLQRHRQLQGLSRKKSGKSRLQFVTTTGDHEADDEMSPRDQPNNIQGGPLHEINVRIAPTVFSSIGVFTHSVPIKCLITGLLGCSSVMSNKICVDDSSVTVLQHSWKTGWQIKRLNDTSHLRLL